MGGWVGGGGVGLDLVVALSSDLVHIRTEQKIGDSFGCPKMLGVGVLTSIKPIRSRHGDDVTLVIVFRISWRGYMTIG